MRSRVFNLFAVLAVLMVVAAAVVSSAPQQRVAAGQRQRQAASEEDPKTPSVATVAPTQIPTEGDEAVREAGAVKLAPQDTAAPVEVEVDLARPVDPGAQDARSRLTSYQIDRCLAVATEIDSDLGLRLAKLRGEKSPQEFQMIMQKVLGTPGGRRLLSLVELQSRDPELYRTKVGELAQDTMVRKVAAKLREAVRTGSQGEAEALRAQLENLLRIQLAMSIKARAEYLCRLEDHIQEVREEIDREATRFEETVQLRLQRLIEDPEQSKSGILPVLGEVVTPQSGQE